MSRTILLALSAAAILATTAVSCRSPTTAGAIPANVMITDYNGSFSYKLDVGEGSHDVYFVFTNTNLYMGAKKAPTVRGLSIDGLELPAPSEQPAREPSEDSASIRDRIAIDNRSLFSRLGSGARAAASSSSGIEPEEPSADVAGVTTGSMKVVSGSGLMSAGATCRYVSPTVTTDQGNRVLNIWVADDCWTPAAGKKHAVTQAMVDALAAKFLLLGSDNDIYDWVTNILGPEWGSTGYSDLIAANGEITILLADIEADNADNGGMVGYFYSLNNFTNLGLAGSPYAGLSNERIMFVVDAVMYANPDDNGYGLGQPGYVGSAWANTDYWAEEVFSTLAHEFQHMIHFYRKGIVVRGDGYSADTWIDEMCSQLVEDLVASSSKLNVMGPRGVSPTLGTAGPTGNKNGRIPIFNDYPSLGLTQTGSYDVYDYSFSYSFGAWLARDFGGANFVRDVVYDYATDSASITDAVRKASNRNISMSGLLQRWAVSVLGSSRLDMPPGYRYNTGGWTTSMIEGKSYDLGSIDFFNYDPAPAILTQSGVLSLGKTGLSPIGYFPQASNVYFKAATGLSGSRTFSLSVPSGVAFSVYVTP